MRNPQRTSLALGLAVLLFALAGCGTVVTESKGVAPADRDAAGFDLAASGDESTDDESAGPEDQDQAKQDVTDLFVWIFDGSQGSVDEKLARVFNGDSIAETLVSVMEANADIFAVLTAQINDVEFTESDRANVTFDLSVDGEPTLTGANGDAIFVDGEWLIDAALMCDLVALADSGAPCVPDDSSDL